MTTPEIDLDRVKAAELLKSLACYDTHYYTPKKFDADVELIMDHVRAERERIVEPLIEAKRLVIEDGCWDIDNAPTHSAINESLRRAGRKE
jgi:hypothetical protein